jgi:UDP-N-acetyl-D-galactosamine dehydrogenase
MGAHVADETVKLMLRKGKHVLGGRVLVLGLTFKENCPDIRNTRVVDIIDHLRSYNVEVDVYDPWINTAEALHEYGLNCLSELPAGDRYSAIIIAVGHREFVGMGSDGVRALGEPGAVIYDVKGVLPAGTADGRL